MANQRTAGIKCNLASDVYDRLKVLAKRQGIPAALLGSVAIGQYVSQHMVAIDGQAELQAKLLEVMDRLPEQLMLLDSQGKA
jgi:hypothetical protein